MPFSFSDLHLRRLLTYLGVVLVGLFLLAQLIPYGREHANPPVVLEPRWANPTTLALAQRSCFDCHSNKTRWPWYAKIAPISWLVTHDVMEGREHLNFSDWQGGRRKGESPRRLQKEIRKGDMPPLTYLLAHDEARLSPEEKQQLIRGLEETVRISQSSR